MTSMGIDAAASGLQLIERGMRVTANNIANADTIAFKSYMLETTDGPYVNLVSSGSKIVPAQVGSGAQLAGIYRILEQGGFKTTQQPLDVAISGAGYFSIAVANFPNGRGFTRNGAFQLDPTTRRLVTAQGDSLDPEIVVPDGISASSITITKDGEVSYPDPTTKQKQVIGQLQLYIFPNERGLEAKGTNMLVETDASGEAMPLENQSLSFLQGTLELSNVSTIDELMRLVKYQQDHAMLTKLINIASSLQQSLADKISG